MSPHSPFAASAEKRDAGLDRIRVVLTALVIFHHTAITYGAEGGWYLKEPRTLAAAVPLTIFCSINQAFFMGFFFLLAGYFTPTAELRKGMGRFVADRLIRLGIPLVVYGLLIGPATEALADTMQGISLVPDIVQRLGEMEFESGPLWFAWALLLMTGAFCLWRAGFHRSRAAGKARIPELGAFAHLFLLGAAVAVGIAAFLIRLAFPVGQNVWQLQLGYFASYLFLFRLGCYGARGHLLERVTFRFARPWMAVSLVASPLLVVYAIAAGALRGVAFHTNGGLTMPALAYAFWEPLVAWGIILAFLARAQKTGAKPRPLMDRLHRSAFGAYIVHPPIVVGLTLLLHPLPIAALVKFAIVGTASVGIAFSLAWVLRQLPGFRTVL